MEVGAIARRKSWQCPRWYELRYGIESRKENRKAAQKLSKKWKEESNKKWEEHNEERKELNEAYKKIISFGKSHFCIKSVAASRPASADETVAFDLTEDLNRLASLESNLRKLLRDEM